jgi:hypothetical protein
VIGRRGYIAVFSATDGHEMVDQVSRGSGVMVVYRRREGQVFNASSGEWVNGLRVGEPFTEAKATH